MYVCTLTDAMAAVTCTKTTQNPSGWVDPNVNNYCTSGSTTKWYIMNGTSLNDVMRPCTSCTSAGTLVPISSSTNSALFAVCSNANDLAKGLYTCVAKSSSCDSSTCSGTTYTTNDTTHQRIKTTKSCQSGQCVTTTTYECSNGYYTTDNAITCTKCPTIGKDNVAANTFAAVVPITGCYISPNVDFQDDKGTGHFTGGPCAYSK